MIEQVEVEARLKSAFPNAQLIKVEDMTGTKDHYQATIVDAVFASMTHLERHRSVYRALGDWMAGPIHALALETFTPEAWLAHSAKTA